jgi:hypothetical protein
VDPLVKQLWNPERSKNYIERIKRAGDKYILHDSMPPKGCPIWCMNSTALYKYGLEEGPETSSDKGPGKDPPQKDDKKRRKKTPTPEEITSEFDTTTDSDEKSKSKKRRRSRGKKSRERGGEGISRILSDPEILGDKNPPPPDDTYKESNSKKRGRSGGEKGGEIGGKGISGTKKSNNKKGGKNFNKLTSKNKSIRK